MLQIVFFALAIGMGTTFLPPEKRRPILGFFRCDDRCLDPYCFDFNEMGAVCCVLSVGEGYSDNGVGDTTDFDGVFHLCDLGIGINGCWRVWSIDSLFYKMQVTTFLKGILPAQLLAFSSSSSSATMPVTLQCVNENLKVREEVSSFIIPLGATINMDGTALYQGVAALFIVQLYGIPIDAMDQLTIVLTATLASIGTAGVPGVGLIMLVVVLQGIGVSPENMQGGLAIIFGVDHILDMCRTTCNVTGDCAVCLVVDQSEMSMEEKVEVLDDVTK